MASPEELDTLLIKSLLLLEWRLKRLEFVVGGEDRSGEEADASNTSLTILARLDKLEKKWQRLVKQERIAGDINELYHTRRELFTSIDDAEESREASLPPPTLQLSTLRTLSPQIQEAASGLSSLELPFPPTSSFTTLATLAPRMAAIDDRQVSQALEISELRKRSMMAVSRYKKVHVEGQREVLREWAGLLGSWERELGREEVKRRREQQ